MQSEYLRRTEGRIDRHKSLADLFGEGERFLFVAPHDDDVALGGGLLLQLALQEGIACRLLVVTDGCMGYCHADEDDIVRVRRAEACAAYARLGLNADQISWGGLPDNRLSCHSGRYRTEPDGAGQLMGHAGLQNLFTYTLRQFRPTRCFLPTSSDLHPDHRLTHSEFMVSLFHAAGAIWPELGEPLAAIPAVHELAVYCDFPAKPDIQIRAADELFRRKLEAVGLFGSQDQIESLVGIVSRGGPLEYLRTLDFNLYEPGRYAELFRED